MSRLRAIFATGLSAGLVATGTAVAPARAAGPGAVGAQICPSEPVAVGYYRMWRDVATTKEADRAPNVQRLDDVPAQLDIVSAFATKPQEDPDFWQALRSTYLPKLHAPGPRVVFTLFVEDFIGSDIPMTQESYDAIARDLYQTYILDWGLDGLDIDVERSLSGDQLTRASGILTALGRHIGPQSGTDHLYIYDTNMTGAHPLFRSLAPYLDYTFLQAYGRNPASLQSSWQSFAPYISSCQFLPGFSFYEERGARWGDVRPPLATSRAAQYADWQPAGGEKAGIFAYAIDRDGKVEGDDTITRTNFSWMRTLKQRMLDADLAG